jgi:pimeloyl-ACP methyl ester carboxylesterase
MTHPLVPLALAFALATSTAASAAQESSAMPTTRTEMIAIHGHRVAFHVTPGKRPAIVLDAGGGADAGYWDALVPQIARRTGREVITYDRAGMGASDEVAGPWNLQAAADDLEAGLRKLGATHGVVLVAHSLAGEIATVLANRHPHWLAGAVLVDANVPEFFSDEVVDRMSAMYAPAVQAAASAPSTPASRQLVALATSFGEVSRAFHRMAWPAEVPAVVIVSAQTPFEEPAAAQGWRDAHARFVGAGPNRKLIVADRSSHDVAHDRPDVVLDAIAKLTAAR